jgi:hypothetical protein
MHFPERVKHVGSYPTDPVTAASLGQPASWRSCNQAVVEPSASASMVGRVTCQHAGNLAKLRVGSAAGAEVRCIGLCCRDR